MQLLLALPSRKLKLLVKMLSRHLEVLAIRLSRQLELLVKRLSRHLELPAIRLSRQLEMVRRHPSTEAGVKPTARLGRSRKRVTRSSSQ